MMLDPVLLPEQHLNNRLSDMQAIMEQTQAFENRVLERLNAG